MNTANDLIKAAYRLIGNKTMTAATDVTYGLEALNSLLSNLSASNAFIPKITIESFTLVAGTGSYSIGSGQTLNTTLPMSIKAAYIRSSENVDTPVDIITGEEYNRISSKATQGKPVGLFFVYGAASGTIYLYPVPSIAYTLFIESYKPMSRYAAKTDSLGIPTEYERPLKFLLSLDLASEANAFSDIRFAQLKSVARGARKSIESLNMARTGIAPQRFRELAGMFK